MPTFTGCALAVPLFHAPMPAPETPVPLSGLAGNRLESLGQTIELELAAVGIDAFGLQVHATTSVRICW